MLYVDTSAIVKLYFKEAYSRDTSNWLKENNEAIPLTSFHELELINAIQLKRFRKEITTDQTHLTISRLEAHEVNGVYYRPQLDWSAIFIHAIDLSKKHSAITGSRSLDILHVASALSINADRFLTFDGRQNRLAELAGLKIVAVNGSPRKKWNTAAMLEKAIEGAAAQEAETDLIHLYDLNFKGCISCFACKKKNGKSYGRCAVKDDLTPVYAEIYSADAIILGSPIYFGNTTGQFRSFWERLLFPYYVYTAPRQTLFPRKIHTGLIYTMNVTEEQAQALGYDRLFNSTEGFMRLIFGHAESIMSYDTYQFKDYSEVVSESLDGTQKKKRRQEVFPKDCQTAYDMGGRFAKEPV